MRAGFIFFLALLFICFVSSDENTLICPTVFDGSVLQIDQETQSSTNTISANWFGLERNQVLSYEWSIISENLATDAVLKKECRKFSGIKNPDVMSWTSSRMSSRVSKSNLKLEENTKYFVMLHIILEDGTFLFTNSDGILVKSEPFEEETKQEVEKISIKIPKKRSIEITKAARSSEFSDGCPLDFDNRCNLVVDRNRVGKHLNDIYGPPIWYQTSQAGLLYRLPSTAEIALEIGLPGPGEIVPTKQDVPRFIPPPTPVIHKPENTSEEEGGGHHLSAGGIVAIAVAVPVGSGLLLLSILLIVLLCILLLLLCLIILCILLLAPKKFDENFTVKTNDVIDSDMGNRTEVSMGDNSTRVEFPDLDAPS